MNQLLIGLALSLPVAADEQPTQAEREIEEANAVTLAAFQRMKCFIAGDKPIPLTPTKGSRLRWSNPVVGRIYGNVFLWTEESGRPVVAVSIFKAYAPWTGLDVECSSLSEKRLLLTCDGRSIWTPPPSTLVWKPVPAVQPPAATKEARLIQMRAVARRFEARVADTRNVKDKQVDRALRPLTQPIYRYAAQQSGIVDAGMFTFTVGTDPEAFLLLECRKVTGGKDAWHYALARMNRDGLEVRLDKEKVWTADFIPVEKVTNRDSPYRSAPVPMPQ